MFFEKVGFLKKKYFFDTFRFFSKKHIFYLLTSNACNFAIAGSWAVKFLPVSDLGVFFHIFEFAVRIVLLLFEFLEFIAGRIYWIFIENYVKITKVQYFVYVFLRHLTTQPTGSSQVCWGGECSFSEILIFLSGIGMV